MGSVGDAYDNAMAESFFATLECELLDRRTFKTQAEARMAVFEFIEGFYNPRRRHSSLGYLSPVDYERHHTRQADPGAHHAAVVLRPPSRCGLEMSRRILTSARRPILTRPCARRRVRREWAGTKVRAPQGARTKVLARTRRIHIRSLDR